MPSRPLRASVREGKDDAAGPRQQGGLGRDAQAVVGQDHEGRARDLFRPDDAPEQSYSERQIFEAASSRLARELGAMEQTDEKGALAKILEILNKASLIHNKTKEPA